MKTKNKLPKVEIVRGRSGRVSYVNINGERAKNVSTSNRIVFATKSFVVKLAKKRDDDPTWAGSSKKQNLAEIAVWRRAVRAKLTEYFARIFDYTKDGSYILMERVSGTYGAKWGVWGNSAVSRKAREIEKKLKFDSESQFFVTDEDAPAFKFYDYGFTPKGC